MNSIDFPEPLIFKVFYIQMSLRNETIISNTTTSVSCFLEFLAILEG
jgi:hypothetical protein